MRRFMRNKFKMKLRKPTGLLVQAPPALRGRDIDFLLIGEDGVEYQLKGNRKTFKMWNLIDTKVQVTGITSKDQDDPCQIYTLSYKCIDDFIDTDTLPINDLEDAKIDIKRLDFAI